MRFLFVFTICLSFLGSCAQQKDTGLFKKPIADTFSFALGNRLIKLVRTTYDTANKTVFVQLHDNEHTAKRAAVAYLKQNGGTLISLLNNNERNIWFKLQGKYYGFDPNRMFSYKGILSSLKNNDRSSPAAIAHIQNFAAFVLAHINKGSVVVALHNNTNKYFSVRSYASDNDFVKDAAQVWVNEKVDADDFFITTEAGIYNRLKQGAFNIVLQNKEADDDGSLSIYYGKRGKPYINIETEFDHFNEQVKMLQAVNELMD